MAHYDFGKMAQRIHEGFSMYNSCKTQGEGAQLELTYKGCWKSDVMEGFLILDFLQARRMKLQTWNETSNWNEICKIKEIQTINRSVMKLKKKYLRLTYITGHNSRPLYHQWQSRGWKNHLLQDWICTDNGNHESNKEMVTYKIAAALTHYSSLKGITTWSIQTKSVGPWVHSTGKLKSALKNYQNATSSTWLQFWKLASVTHYLLVYMLPQLCDKIVCTDYRAPATWMFRTTTYPEAQPTEVATYSLDYALHAKQVLFV